MGRGLLLLVITLSIDQDNDGTIDLVRVLLPFPFGDDFERPDSSDLGPYWDEVSADWEITAGRLHGTAADEAWCLTAQPLAQERFILESRVYLHQPPGYAALAFGGDGTPGQGYELRFDGASSHLYLVKDGQPLKGGGGEPVDYWDQWLQVKVEREGATGGIAVYLAPEGDDYPAEPTLGVEDDTYPALGHFGWGATGAGTEMFVDSIEARPMK